MQTRDDGSLLSQPNLLIHTSLDARYPHQWSYQQDGVTLLVWILLSPMHASVWNVGGDRLTVPKRIVTFFIAILRPNHPWDILWLFFPRIPLIHAVQLVAR